MGKTLKFPKRGKYVPYLKNTLGEPAKKEEPVSEEEHKKRVEMMKKMGLLKE